MTTAADFHRAWREFPVGGLDDIIGSGTCLVLAPHPDDESLGCGGLIAACTAAGRPPLVVVLTDGAGSHPASRAFPPDRLRAVRAQEVQAAVGHLGLAADRVVFLNQPDSAAPHSGPDFDTAASVLAGLIGRETNCTAILAPWRHDPHCDHEAASLLASCVASTVPIRHLGYPVWGLALPPDAPVPAALNTGFRFDISAFLAAKRAAIRAHQSQYGNLISDDPTGFRLPAALLWAADMPFETFLLA
jgi:LmbE family N-acetylglucosaminyl deacetylase